MDWKQWWTGNRKSMDWKPLLRAYDILRQPTTVKASEKPLPGAYNILQWWRTVKTLAASLHHSTWFIARFIPLLRAYTVLCRFIHSYLSVRLRFLYPVFSPFRTDNVFSPPRQECTAYNVHREVPESAQNTVFCDLQSDVFLPLHDFFLPPIRCCSIVKSYRMSTKTKF
jgi:hypothetical protein